MEINLSIMTKDQLKKFIVELLEENRKLKEESYNELQRLGKENFELREENKRLKAELQEWLNAVGNK